MAEGQRRDAGGIRSLRELIAEHKEAIEFDLIAHGLRLDWLGTERLSWRDLLVIIRQAPPGSALDRAQRPDDAGWGLSEQLLAMVVDNTNWLVWAKTDDAAKNRNRPKPIPRPGVKPDGVTIGSGAIPIDEMAAFLGWDKGGAE